MLKQTDSPFRRKSLVEEEPPKYLFFGLVKRQQNAIFGRWLTRLLIIDYEFFEFWKCPAGSEDNIAEFEKIIAKLNPNSRGEFLLSGNFEHTVSLM